jgi:hypothetical protein
MSDFDFESHLFHQAVMFHGLDMLPRLRALPQAALSEVLKAANSHNSTEPLFLMADQKVFAVPAWGGEPLSGAQVMTLIVFGIWVLAGERADQAMALLQMWPEIRVVCTLIEKGANRPAGTVFV